MTSSPPFDLLPSEPDWTLLGRFFRGECSAEDAEAIALWKAAAPDNAKLIAFMRRVWDEAAVGTPDADTDRGWRTVQARIAMERRQEPVASSVHLLPLTPRVHAPHRRVGLGRLAAAAAAAVIVAVGGLLLWRTGETGMSAAARGAAREYVTARGQRADVMLEDGTRVWLNVDSRLRVLPGYGGTARDVELSGEAYFAVEHDPARPFRVHGRGAVLEDLGTEFDVRAYAGDPVVAVTVTSGLVVVRSESAPAPTPPVLARGQMAQIDSAGRIRVTDGVDIGRVMGWRDGRLLFQERPLAEALRELERWYDLEIVLDDSSLARVPLTAALGQRTSDQALAIVAGVLDARYVRQGRRVHLWAASTR